MNYTKKQYELIGRLHNGVRLASLDEGEREIMIFLDNEQLVQPREYIADGYMELSPKGQCVYESYQNSRKQAAEDAKEKGRERGFQVFLVVLAAVLSAIATNLDRIVGLIYQLIEKG